MHLLRGCDTGKDQTYFLYTLQQNALEKTLFPIGDLQKDEVRQLAKDAGFINSLKKDSTGICFIGERNFRYFLEQYLPARPGDIVSEKGEVLGEHQGLMYYTIGQRKGIGIGGGYGEKESPWYVSGKQLNDNRLVVVQGHDHPSLYHLRLTASQLHWTINPPQRFPFSCSAKIRYRHNDAPCIIESLVDGTIQVQFAEPQFAITPGQSIVFYNHAECLGGAVIDSAES